jgi:hypothetical protein
MHYVSHTTGIATACQVSARTILIVVVASLDFVFRTNLAIVINLDTRCHRRPDCWMVEEQVELTQAAPVIYCRCNRTVRGRHPACHLTTQWAEQKSDYHTSTEELSVSLSRVTYCGRLNLWVGQVRKRWFAVHAGNHIANSTGTSKSSWLKRVLMSTIAQLTPAHQHNRSFPPQLKQ